MTAATCIPWSIYVIIIYLPEMRVCVNTEVVITGIQSAEALYIIHICGGAVLL